MRIGLRSLGLGFERANFAKGLTVHTHNQPIITGITGELTTDDWPVCSHRRYVRSSSISILVGVLGQVRAGLSLRTIHPAGNLIGSSLARSIRTVSSCPVISSMEEKRSRGERRS